VPWLVLLAVLSSPILLVSIYGRSKVARIGLSLVWILCGLGGAWFLVQARDAEKDLETLHEYRLPLDPGFQRIDLRTLSQGSMEGVLRGAGEKPSRADLEKLRWAFPAGVSVSWYEFSAREDWSPGDLPLFQIHWGVPLQQSPLALEYHVGQEVPDFLRSRVLVVTHDASARHLIRDHLLPVLHLFGWGLLGWGGLWLAVQAVREISRRKNHDPRIQS